MLLFYLFFQMAYFKVKDKIYCSRNRRYNDHDLTILLPFHSSYEAWRTKWQGDCTSNIFPLQSKTKYFEELLLVLNIKSIICIPMIDLSKWLTSPSTTFRNDTQKDPSLDVYAAEWDNSCSQVNLPVHSLVSEKHQQ